MPAATFDALVRDGAQVPGAHLVDDGEAALAVAHGGEVRDRDDPAVPRVDAPEGTALQPVPGTVRDRLPWAQGCAFAPRCTAADDACRSGEIALGAAGTAGGSSGHAARCVHPADLEVTR